MGMLSQEDEDNILQSLPEEDRAAALAQGGEAPTPAAPTSSGDILRSYLTGGGGAAPDPRVQKAQALSNKNLLAARLAQSGANIGAAIAKAHPIDQKPFEQLAESANLPVDNTNKQIALENTRSKLLQDYFAKDTANKLSQDRIGAYSKRTDAMSANATRRLDLGDKRIGFTEEQHAAQAADKFRNDKVMMTTSTQNQQLDKALGRIADIRGGKTKFTTAMKADLEKDLANVISGGTSSSLGQLDRLEFNSYATQWQHALEKINGYQGDINSPEYLAQLEQTFNGLKHDIAQIQSKRAKHIAGTLGTAYSNNKLATKAIQDNVTLNSEGAGEGGAPPRANPQLDAAKGWLADPKNAQDPQRAAVEAKVKKMEMGA